MKLVVGLGNPGREHENNRHNIGFRILSFWAHQHGVELKENRKLRGIVGKLNLADGSEAVLLLPTTYMNHSGDAIALCRGFYKIDIKDCIVIYDDLDIPAGTFRIRPGGGHGGHNGLRSIVSQGKEFIRFRMGIGRPPHPQMPVVNYVLGNFSAPEMQAWEKQFDNVRDALELCVSDKLQEAMNRYNRKD